MSLPALPLGGEQPVTSYDRLHYASFVVKLHSVVQFGSPIFLYSGSLETQYWRGFARVGCAKLKMFALLDCSELPLRPEPALAVDNPAAHPRWTAALRAVPGSAHRRRYRD